MTINKKDNIEKNNDLPFTFRKSPTTASSDVSKDFQQYS